MKQKIEALPRVRRGLVKFNVRRHAVELGAFTVADILRATHLNAKSVRTELRRMEDEGLLARRASSGKSGQRGGPPIQYRLTDDPAARSALARSLESSSASRSPGARTTSPHYLAARELLNQAQQVSGADDREPLLAAAEQRLVMAAEAEGGERAPDRVILHLEYERARLSCLRGVDDDATRRVAALRERCAGLQDETMARHLEELQLYLEAHRSFAAQASSNVDEVTWAHCLLDTLDANAYQAESPLTALLLAMLSRLVGRSAPERMQRFLHAKLPALQPPSTANLARTRAAMAEMVSPWSRDEAATHLRRARAAFQLERFDEALLDFDRAIALAPADPRAIAARGATYRRLQRHDDALVDLGRAIELLPNFAWAIAERGHVFRVKGLYDEALADFDRAIDLEPDYAWAVAERGKVYHAKGFYDEALGSFDLAIALDSDDPWLVASRGQLHRAKLRYDEALADFNLAVSLAPDHPWLLTSRGHLCQSRGRYDEAMADFDRAIDLDPQAPWPVAERAHLYRRVGRNEVANLDFKRAQTIQPIQQVRRDLEKVLTLIPSKHPEAPAIRALLDRLQQPDASWETLTEAALAA